MNYIQKQENQTSMIAQSLGSSKEEVVESLQKSIEEAEAARKKVKTMLRKITPSIAKSISEEAKQLSSSGIKFYHVSDNEMDEEYHISIGEKSIESDPSLIYVAFISKGEGIRVIVFVGEQHRKNKSRQHRKANFCSIRRFRWWQW